MTWPPDASPHDSGGVQDLRYTTGHQSSRSVWAAHFFSGEHLWFDSALFTRSLELIFQSDRLALPQCSSAPSALKHTHKYFTFTYELALRHTFTNLSIHCSVYLFSKYLYLTTPHYGSLLCNHSCKVCTAGYACINSINYYEPIKCDSDD